MKKQALVPWLLAAVIFGPFVAATLLYFGSPSLDWLPRLAGSRELVEPPVPTAPGWLQGAPAPGAEPKWTLIYARMAACDEQCGLDLERLRQVHVALRRDADRLQRVFLHGEEPEAAAPKGDPDLVMRRIDDPEAAAVVAAIGAERLELGRVLLVDARDHLMASYPKEVDQKELLRDLKRLLSLSGSH